MSSRFFCCETCDRNPYCGVDCGSCKPKESIDEPMNDCDQECPSCGGTGVCATCHGQGIKDLLSMKDEHIGDRLWLEPSSNDPKHRGTITDFAATRCPCSDPQCAGIVVAIQSASDIDTMTVTQTTARLMIEVLQLALKEYSNGNDESFEGLLRRRYNLP